MPRLHPRRWRPLADAGLVGAFAPNERLAGLERWELDAAGPEDVAIDPEGTIYTGVADGRIMRLEARDGLPGEVTRTGGRPLGIEVDRDGSLVVCDADRGLLRIDPRTQEVSVLVDQLDGVPFRCTNNAAIASDGSVFFTDSSRAFGVRQFKGDLLEHGCTGRLLRWHPDGQTTVLLDGLAFANGVALASDESHVLVAETGAYRVRRLWLTGPRIGQSEVLINNLPGFPDNMSTGSAGITWIAIASRRNSLLDFLLPRSGLWRKLIWLLPDRLQPEASRITFVIGIDAEGEVVHNLQAPGDQYHYVTGVREHAGTLYLGSLVDTAVAKVPIG